MKPGDRERRGKTLSADRQSFGVLAQAALKRRIRDARGTGVRWVVEPNLAWASWPAADGRLSFTCIRRHLGLINGELGASTSVVELDALALVSSLAEAPPEGCRMQLGVILHGHAKSWSAGGSEAALIERLDWVATQLGLRMLSFLSSTRPADT